jgi:hypothetical protein
LERMGEAVIAGGGSLNDVGDSLGPTASIPDAMVSLGSGLAAVGNISLAKTILLQSIRYSKTDDWSVGELDAAIAAIVKPILEDRSDIEGAAKVLIEVSDAGFPESVAGQFDDFLSRLNESRFADVVDYPLLVCSAALTGRDLQARQIADRAPAELSLPSYSIVAAHVASKRWPNPSRASSKLVCLLDR